MRTLPSSCGMASSDSEVVRFIRARAVRHWKTLLFLSSLSFASVALAALSPFLVQRFVDALTKRSFLPLLAVGLLVAIIVGKVIGTCLSYYVEITQTRAGKDFTIELYEHLQTVKLAQIKEHTSGEFLSKILNDAENFGRGFVIYYPMVALSLLQVIVTATVLFLLEWRLALIAIAVLPVSFFCTRWLNWRLRMGWEAERENWGRVIESLREKIDGMKTIKAFRRGQFFSRLFRQDVNRWFESYRRTVVYSQLTEAVLSRATEVLAIALLIVGALFALRGWMSVGGVIAFFWYAGNLYGPIQALVAWNNSKQQIIPVGKRILSLLASQSGEERAGPPLPASPAISFHSVSAGYGTVQVLHNVSLEFESGKMSAVVGESGSGKSTLVSLLLEFNRPTQGEIFISGRPLEEYGTRELREGIAFSSSEAFLFNMSIRDNITLGGEYTDAEIIEAAKTAGIHEFVAGLPEGYGTHVGERGTKLSDGERQRIALARALIKRPKILILDEATSGVDSKTEARIYEGLRGLGLNLIVVAHRLSTIYMADLISVLDGGRVVCQGTHSELLERCPVYRALFEKQLVEATGGAQQPA